MNQEITFGQAVKERRELLGLTQAELGRRVGCAAITIRRIEADSLRPSVQIAENLAAALGIAEADYLAFVRLARANREPSPLPTPPPVLEEIGLEDLSGRAIRGYQLGERIGSGGYGVVYRAAQATIKREVAVKIILPKFADRPEFIRRFEAEAQLVARLEHPHIVPLYDYWREPGVAYLVMRLLRGGSLATQLKNGPLAPETMLPLLEQICAGLHAAHQAGVIHRDIKPANILLDQANNAYLADFGIAKITADDSVGETLEGMVLGSPAYISPEQILVEPVKPQSDVYSLGVMLYELLTGHKPFDGPTPFALIQQHLNEPFPSLALYRLNQDCVDSFDPIIQRATAKEQSARYTDVLALLADFRQAATTADHRPPTTTPTLTPSPLKGEGWGGGLTNPYKGLRAFTEADAADFFGRETLVQELLARLADSTDLARFLAVVGPSGSGKSSVVRAGLIPALRQGGLPDSDKWFIIEMLPGSHPWEELEAALLRIAVNPPESLLAQLREDERGLLRAVRRILPADESVELVLIIDQFEELFTLVADEDVRQHFLNSLVTAVLDPRSRLRVIITLRADFTGHPLQYVDFGELLRQRTEFVLPLTPDELEQAISNPVRRVGLALEPGLVAAISRDVGQEPGALPLLQYALTELFERSMLNVERFAEAPLLTRAAYQASGGVLGALARRADEIYAGLDVAGQEATRQLFLRLITLGEGTEDTRRRVLRAEVETLSPTLSLWEREQAELPSPFGRGAGGEGETPIETVIELFGRHRLLSFDRDPITRSPTVEVAHEALLREWGRLREWLDASRNDIRMQRLLATAAAEWREADQDASFLLRGTRLEQFAGWAANTDLALTSEERTFLEASLAARKARQAEEEARRRRELETAQKLAETEKQRAEEQAQAAQRLRRRALFLAGALVIAAILAVVAVVFGQQASQNERRALAQQAMAEAEANSRATAQVIAEVEQKEAEHQAQIAFARELAAAAVSNLEVDPERSILLALQAVTTTYDQDKAVTVEAENALHQAVLASRVLLTLTGHTDDLRGIDFSPDGTRLATASWDGTAKVWDAASGQELLTLSGHADRVNRVVFSPDGTRLATNSFDDTIKIWDAASDQELYTLLSGHEGGVFGLAFSPDGKHLATGNEDGTVQLWLLPPVAKSANTSGEIKELFTLVGHTAGVAEVEFSPDGKHLATASSDQTAKVWDITSGQELLTLSGHTLDLNDLSYSPDGTRLATASWDGTVKIWDTATGQLLLNLTGHTSEVWDATFSPDGTRLATASPDGTAKLWDTTSGRELITLAGHTGSVRKVTFSPDGTHLATASVDGTARVWDISPSCEGLTLTDLEGEIVEVVYSPDGTRLAASNGFGTVKIWDAASGQGLLAIAAHKEWISGVTFSPDGTRLATASDDGTAKVWDVTSGQALLTLSGHTDWVNRVTFSPDGARLATASADDTVKIWEATSGQELLTLSGHNDMVWDVAFNPDGTHLATASSDKTIRLWDAASGQELLTLSGHTDAVNRVNFSPDGTQLASSSWDGTARVWDASSGQELLTLTGHTGPVWGLDFNTEATHLVTGSTDGTAKTWDLASGQELLSLTGHTHSINSLDLSPDGTRLATASSDGTVRVYVLPIEELVELAHSRLTRTWTVEECQRFLHQPTCP
ncbi:MAG: protein kinase [Anaerolineae bacterium]|nr:protein kinase [Anaerolineae bacterium]